MGRVPPHIFVQTLGIVAIDIGERRIGPSSGRPFAFLLYLASRRGHASARRVIQELLFPEAESGKAAHSVRQLLYRLRQLGAPIEADADQICVPATLVSVDWWNLLDERQLAVAELEQLSHGLFPGYSPDVSESYREWFEAERADITLRLSRTLTSQLTQLRDQVARYAEWAIDIVRLTREQVRDPSLKRRERSVLRQEARLTDARLSP